MDESIEKFQGFFVKKGNNYEIAFSLQKPGQKIPPDKFRLYQEIAKTNTEILKIFEKDKIKLEKNFDKLLALAQVGLAGPDATPDIALISLQILKNDILIEEGPRLKNRYMAKLGLWALFYTVVCISIFFILNLENNENSAVSKYFFVFIGALVGSWVSFGIRKLDISFEDLVSFEKDKMTYSIRLIFIGIVSIIFAMLVKNKFIDISLGNGKLSSLLIENNGGNIEKNLLFGIMCGILDKNLALNLYLKSGNILKMNKKGEDNG